MAVARDAWDWVVVVGVPVGVVIGIVSLTAAFIALHRVGPLLTIDGTSLQSAPDHPDLEFQLNLTVTAPTVWRVKRSELIIRMDSIWPWKRRRVEGLREMTEFPASGSGDTKVYLAWLIPRPEAERLRAKVKIRMHRQGRSTFRRMFDIPSPAAPRSE